MRNNNNQDKDIYKRGASSLQKYMPKQILNIFPQQYNPVTYQQIYGLIKNKYPQNGLDIIALIQKNQHFNKALGSLYGSFIGDALGSYIQFKSYISKENLIQAMQMKPGGTFDLDAGQLTDDSQLALELGQALLTFNENNYLVQQVDNIGKNIAFNYCRWFKSAPFDIGNTCSTSFQNFEKILQSQKTSEEVIQKIKQVTKSANEKSESNGSLMRIIPLAIFCSYLKSQAKYQLCIKQIRMTHSHDTIIQSSLQWIKLLQNIIAKENTHQNHKKIYDQFLIRCKKHPALYSWLDLIKNPKILPDQGWARNIWAYSILQLQNIIKNNISLDQNLYISQIQKVLSYGGDTDTNACILGGLIGSLIGFKNLPFKYLKKLLKLQFSNSSRKRRPKNYEPINGVKMVYEMYRKYC